MVTNLRVLSVTASDNVTLVALFSDALNPNIGAANVTIISQTPGVPSPLALQAQVNDRTLTITTQPLTSLAAYVVVFSSTSAVPFHSLHNDAVLFEDGVANKQLFLGPIESTNVIKDYFLKYLQDNVYNLDAGSVLSDYLDTLSALLSEGLFDIRQARSDNYLSLTITDERKTRGAIAFDHLDIEGAFEILRVGLTPTSTISNMTLTIEQFEDKPITLLQVNGSDNLTINSVDRPGIFNINSLVMTLNHRFVTKLQSVVFTYTDGHLPFTYDLDTLGYQILDPKYDSDIAFRYLLLQDNQVKLSDKLLEDPNFSSVHIFQIQVTYQYKDSGRIIDPASLAVTSVQSSGREVLPTLFNVFNLKHAPVVNSSNLVGTIGDIKFVDQNVLAILGTSHPAFVTEIAFRLELLPSRPGEYSVDYATGTVYVFGADRGATGTGATPPLAIYNYRLTYKENVDWTLEPDTNDLVALPNGNLINNKADVSFDFEQVLAQDIDYKAQIHQEILDERIGNRLVALNALTVNYAPVTNVFRVFNETTGEIYRIIRWINNKVIFAYTTPPNIQEILGERASFENVSNEVLFVSQVLNTLNPAIKIYRMVLNNNNLIAQSEDCIGASFNSTASFSDSTIFAQERYFDPLESEAINLSRLTAVGNYFVNYADGIVYVVVVDGQDVNVGAISYKRGYIITTFPHITSIEDLYYRINTVAAKDKHFAFTKFGDGYVLPSSFDHADEQLLNNETQTPYVVFNSQIGSFVDSGFVNQVTDNIQLIRHLFEDNDLLFNVQPINFAEAAIFSNKTITLGSVQRSEYHSVEFSGGNYFVVLNTGLHYQSPNITLTINVVRLSDNAQLWNGSGVIGLGNLIKLTLPGINSPQVGDSVLVSYSYTINNLSHVIVDYNKGEYYIDYSALIDEIIVSYEHGNNALDFRSSTAINAGDTYFVTYKVGALRDALLKNFGSLIDIPMLNTFDVTFGRERYRDAIVSAMHSLSSGPTVGTIKRIAQTISHLPANVRESIFETWSLGFSMLFPRPFTTTGNLQLLPGRHGSGILIDQSDQSVKLPAVSNLKLEDGTFEAWVRPEWDGLDNLAELQISPFKDGYLMSPLDVFIGALEYHPTYMVDNKGNTFFTLDKNKRTEGIPNRNKDGVYIYYANDVSGMFKRWFVEIFDGYANDHLTDGYVTKHYSIKINTNGRFYDLKSLSNPQPSTTRITSGTNSAIFAVTSVLPNEGITFVADIPHYILDVAGKQDRNRLSLFKDESGYLVLKVYDSSTTSYIVSANVSNWRHGDLHHVAATWKINNVMGHDELHLFVDGFEVPNILRYGDRIKPYLHEKFRTVNPEEIVGVVGANIIAGNDLVTLSGSTNVSSTINFSQYGISIGGTLYIEEPGFITTGYTIINVNGNTLTLNASMPLTISNGKFSVNKISFNVTTEIDVFPNFAVSLVHSYLKATDLSTVSGSNTLHSATTNFLTSGVVVGDLVRINNNSFAKSYVVLQVASNSLVVNDNMPISLSSLSFDLYHNLEQEIPGLRALHPAYELSKSTDGLRTNILTLRDKALIDDLILIRTLGLNHRRIRRKYFVWGNQQHILKSKLSTPISLDDVKIYKILLNTTLIGSANSTFSLGVFNSNNLVVDGVSNTTDGRILSVSIQGTNVDFSTPTTVDIHGFVVDGYDNLTFTTETLTFTAPGIQDTTNLFVDVAYVNVHCKPFNATQTCAIVEIKEKHSMTLIDNQALFGFNPKAITQPIVKYSYQVGIGNTLGGSDAIVTDPNHFFSSSVVNNYLHILGPNNVAGFYRIVDVSANHHSLTLSATVNSVLPLATFSDGYYQVLNTTDFRSGLQNGFFTFEDANKPGTPYLLSSGWYELDYYTYLQIPFDLTGADLYFGTDLHSRDQLHGTLDEVQILNVALSDTRIGETAAKTQRTITKDFNSVKASKPDVSSLVLMHADTLPLVNDTSVYRTAERQIMQAGNVINDNFQQSIVLTRHPLQLLNDGILDTKKGGTIEFWVNPLFDAQNDPNYRFYFDAFGAVTEQLISTNNTTIKLLGVASQILSVRLVSSSQDGVNYFAGGQLTNSGTVLQLHKALPNQNTPVLVTYLPNGLKGDRISIYKDPAGYMNFNIHANNLDYNIKAPVFWTRNSWHRVKATYTLNSNKSLDEIHFFLDGYEHGDVLFGSGLLFGQGLVYGSSFAGPNTARYNIKFVDSINQFTIGADHSSNFPAYCLMDNLRISDIARPLYQPFGEPLDPNYSSNIDMVFPITEDLNTTLLLDFDFLAFKNQDFVVLNNRNSTLDEFSVEVLDSFDIIANGGPKVKQILDELIHSFKPATSRAFITYI